MKDTAVGKIEQLSYVNSDIFNDKTSYTELTLTNRYGSHTTRLPGSDLDLDDMIQMFRNLLICATFDVGQIDEYLGLKEE